jgi:hypothetical protein
MPSLHVNSVVRLKEQVPEHGLSRGEEGVVVSVWLSPEGFLFEVEFARPIGSSVLRTLLPATQLELANAQPSGSATN